MICPLCFSSSAALDGEAHRRRFFRCPGCELTFVHPVDRLDRQSELAHYGTHQNDVGDAGYRSFLSRLAAPLMERLPPGSEGLDYGCGPAPALARMLGEHGFRMEVYDPFFAPERDVLERHYDFVTATEVVEHFALPGEELQRIHRLMRPGGWLGIMTELRTEALPLGAWRYARDPTHVALFAPATMRWVARHFGWTVEFSRGSVWLFRKPDTAPARSPGAGDLCESGDPVSHTPNWMPVLRESDPARFATSPRAGRPGSRVAPRLPSPAGRAGF